MTKNVVFDLIVIGAGPAGFSVAAECVYHELGKILVLEKGETHNQTVHQYYPDDKRVDAAYRGQEAVCAGVLCFRDTTKSNFLAIVGEMLKRYSFTIEYGANVDSVQKLKNGLFSVSTSEGKHYRSHFVAIAIGRMGKPNRPDFFNEIPPDVRKRVQFDVRNLDPTGKEVLVVGGGNSAIEFALSLATKGKVTVSYRQKTFGRLNEMNLSLLEGDERNGRIGVLRESNIGRIGVRDGNPLVSFKEGPERVFDHVVFGIGGSSPVAFLQNAGVLLDDKGNPKLNLRLETPVDNLYVAGELSVPQGKGSIIASFNSGKHIVEAIMEKRGQKRKPELVHV